MDNKLQEQNQTSVQIRQYLVIGLEYWYLFFIAMLIAVVFFFVKNKYAYNKYSVNSTIIIKKQNANPELAAGGLLLSSSRNLENEIGIIMSYDLMERVVRQLDFRVSYYLNNKFGYDPELYNKSPFYVDFDTSMAQYDYVNVYIKILNEKSIELSINEFNYKQIHKFNENISIDNFSFKIVKDSTTFNKSSIGKKYYFHFSNLSIITKELKNSLHVDLRSDGSTILWIWQDTEIPSKNIDFINKLIEVYIDDRMQEKNQIAKKTIEFIDSQLKGFSDSLKLSEDKLQLFKQQNSVDISEEGQNFLTQFKDLDKLKKEHVLKRDYYKYLLKISEDNPQQMVVMSPSIMGFSDPILEQYLIKLSEAIYQQKVLQFSVKENSNLHPNTVKSMEINNLSKVIKEYLEQTIKFTNSSIEEVDKKINILQAKIQKLPSAERQMLQITRQFDLNNEIYTFLLQRRMEAGITLASNAPDVGIIDKAKFETIQYKGKDGGIGLVKVLILALIIVIVIIFILELLKNKVEDKNEIERLSETPVVASITYNTRDTQLPTLKYPRASISETFRLLRTNIQYSLFDKNEHKLIVISSTISGEGKSFVAANLASILSFANKKVVLIGLDMRKPKVQKIFKYDNDFGVSDYLIDDISYDELVRKSEYENLKVILPGTIPPNPSELLESEKMSVLLNRIRKEFDYVVIDTPPVGIVADAILLAQKADVFLYIIRQNYSYKSSIKLFNEIVKKNKITNTGIVFNGVKKSAINGLKYGYGYGYYGEGYYDDEYKDSNGRGFMKKITEKWLSKLIKKWE